MKGFCWVYDTYIWLRISLFDLMLTAEIILGLSVILTTKFLGKPPKGSLPVLCVHFFTIN